MEDTKTQNTEVEMQNANQGNTTQQPAVKADDLQKEPDAFDLRAAIAEAVDAATRAAERKVNPVVNSSLAQQGVDPNDAIVKEAIKEYMEKRPTPEKLLEQEKAARQGAEAKAKALEDQLLAVKKGIPADKADKYIRMASGLVDESKTLDAALDEILLDMPTTKVPAMAEGTGDKKMPEVDRLNEILSGKK